MTERTYIAKDETLADALGFIEEELEKYDCPMRELMQITVCVEEMFVNVAHYAYPGSEGEVTLSVGFENGTVTIVLTDSGIPFDPLAKEDPDITLSAEDRPIGGLGIFLCKKLMDSVEYEFTNGCNKLTIRKRIA